jgi:hypothetical protein
MSDNILYLSKPEPLAFQELALVPEYNLAVNIEDNYFSIAPDKCLCGNCNNPIRKNQEKLKELKGVYQVFYNSCHLKFYKKSIKSK